MFLEKPRLFQIFFVCLFQELPKDTQAMQGYEDCSPLVVPSGNAVSVPCTAENRWRQQSVSATIPLRHSRAPLKTFLLIGYDGGIYYKRALLNRPFNLYFML